MKISCVIPLYNAEKYIIETLNSLVNQTYPLDEILVIEDCGSDQSADIIKKYSKKHANIRLIQQPFNQGVSAARNRGLQEARNEWVLMMDADDLAHPELLKKEVELLQKHKNTFPKPVFVHPGYIQINSEGYIIENSEFRGKQYQFKDLFGSILVRNHIITSSGGLLNKDLVIQLGGYKTNLAISEDVELYLRLATKGIFLYLDELYIYYRRHNSNATMDFKKVDQAGKTVLGLYHLEEIENRILCRSYSKSKNIIDLVKVLYQFQRYEEGFKYLEYIKDDDFEQSKLFLQSIFYQEQKQWDKAIDSLDELMNMNNSHGAALNNRAVLYAQNGEVKVAEKLFEKALSLFPGYMDATDNLHVLHENEGKYHFTKRELRKNLLRYS